MNDVPDPSERCTTTMSASGSFRPGLADAMRASLHFVIFPRKMSASTSGVNRSVSFTSGRLYVGTSPPRTVGMCSTLPLIAAMAGTDRKSTRLNSSHVAISYAVFCLKKKKKKKQAQKHRQYKKI